MHTLPSLCRGQTLTPANAQNAAEEKKSRGISLVSAETHLLLDLVRAAEHVVNVGEVVGTREEAIGLAGGGIALLEMGLLTKVAHLRGVSYVYRQQY